MNQPYNAEGVSPSFILPLSLAEGEACSELATLSGSEGPKEGEGFPNSFYLSQALLFGHPRPLVEQLPASANLIPPAELGQEVPERRDAA